MATLTMGVWMEKPRRGYPCTMSRSLSCKRNNPARPIACSPYSLQTRVLAFVHAQDERGKPWSAVSALVAAGSRLVITPKASVCDEAGASISLRSHSHGIVPVVPNRRQTELPEYRGRDNWVSPIINYGNVSRELHGEWASSGPEAIVK